MAWQFDVPERGEGAIQAFRRPDSSFESARFLLKGLDPAARYEFSDTDSPEKREFSGRELMERGLPVSIMDMPGAVILTYRRTPPVL